MNKLLLSFAFVALLGACAQVTKIGPGEAVIAERIGVPVDSGWNQFGGRFGGSNAAALWTSEGLAIDQLNFYVGVKDGDLIAANPGKEQRPLAFKATMQPHELVALFEAFYTRDGSSFKLDKLEATEFLGQRGWRANYTVVRKFDDVKLSGSVWATVRGGELFAMTFSAPAVGFYARQIAKVEKAAAAARFKQ
ncbi:MAG: hypothetical protein Q8L49_10895 [Burkholderiaceae bacterium]|nr:hypothetical protein [Burkholderiaceae bacterium]